MAELLIVECMGRRRAPQPKRIDRVAAISDHRTVVRHADQRRRGMRNQAHVSVTQFETAAEFHLDGFALARDLPRIGSPEPVVRPLLLPSVAKILPEHAVLVAQSVTHRRKLQCRHGIEVAGRQTAQPAVAQAGVWFLVDHFDPLAGVLGERALNQGIEHEIQDIVGERAADEELDRDIVDPLRIFASIGLVRAQPPIRQKVPDGARDGFVTFARVGGLRLDHAVELQMPFIERVRRSGEAERTVAVSPQKFIALR